MALTADVWPQGHLAVVHHRRASRSSEPSGETAIIHLRTSKRALRERLREDEAEHSYKTVRPHEIYQLFIFHRVVPGMAVM